MREIKFRAYQKNFKRILPVTSIEFNNNEIESITVDNRGVNGEYDVIPWLSTYRAGCEDFPLDSLVLLQYIGMEDKNGIDIYEGDVCEHSDKEHESEALDRAKMFSISYVLFNILEAEMDGKEVDREYKQKVLNYISQVVIC